uniref:Uncharacterized protein n=1 Tax=Euplotes harpa TaxID=151035 RepID=A0A7S3JH57_9SPIT|mmetsp:Transcript_36051/g.41632  ORF Transcript_36051/g.41632 Transcript_36051/m.41632 type:complete len:105 (+) Transcript_36051:189-503(+)
MYKIKFPQFAEISIKEISKGFRAALEALWKTGKLEVCNGSKKELKAVAKFAYKAEEKLTVFMMRVEEHELKRLIPAAERIHISFVQCEIDSANKLEFISTAERK